MFRIVSFEKEIPSGGSQAGNISQSCSLKRMSLSWESKWKLDTLQRGVQSEGGAVDGGSII